MVSAPVGKVFLLAFSLSSSSDADAIATTFLESELFSKYIYHPSNLTRDDTLTKEDGDDFPVILQVNLHAFIECLSMFQVGVAMGGGMGMQRGFEVQRSPFLPIRGTLRFVYEGDGEPFLLMSLPLLPSLKHVSRIALTQF